MALRGHGRRCPPDRAGGEVLHRQRLPSEFSISGLATAPAPRRAVWYFLRFFTWNQFLKQTNYRKCLQHFSTAANVKHLTALLVSRAGVQSCGVLEGVTATRRSGPLGIGVGGQGSAAGLPALCEQGASAPCRPAPRGCRGNGAAWSTAGCPAAAGTGPVHRPSPQTQETAFWLPARSRARRRPWREARSTARACERPAIL